MKDQMEIINNQTPESRDVYCMAMANKNYTVQAERCAVVMFCTSNFFSSFISFFFYILINLSSYK
jgi:hypothetical protein